MESNSEASCISDPNFAVICAFLERFAKPCGITHPPFLDLQEMLENINEVPQQLIDLHIILLRKARRSVFREKWEKALVKFCQIYSAQDGWEIERFGYKNSRLEVKLRVLKNLLEGQFDLNCKFKSIINTHESSELRSKPVGKDKSGRIYWLQVDPISNIRVYREDLDEESWTLVAKDRDTLVQLLQELTVDEEPVDVNLLNEDSSVSAEIEKTILDTGQENGISDVVTNGDALIEEKDPLEIKTGDAMINDVGYDDCYNDVLNDVGKRAPEDLFPEGDFKKVKLDEGENDMDIGEAIEDPVLHVYGEGNGAECDAGNPDKEEQKNNEGNSSNTSDQSEPGQTTSTDMKKLELETKPQPKLWSIDTICGTGFNHSGESSKSVKSVQKNFSSFSIESVLEKKSDSNHSLSPVPESSLISVNMITANDPAPENIDQTEEQIPSASEFTEERIEPQACSESTEDISASEEVKIGPTETAEEEDKRANCENETAPVPVVENRTNEEDSTICAENSIEEKQSEAIDHAHEANLKVNSEDTTSIKQEVPDAGAQCLESIEENIHSESESINLPTESEITLKVESDNLETKQSHNIEKVSLEHSESVNKDEIGGCLDVAVGSCEKPTEVIEEPKDEVTKIVDAMEEVSPDKSDDKEPKDEPVEQLKEKLEERVIEIKDVPMAEEPEESEKNDPEVVPDEKEKHLLEANVSGDSSDKVLPVEEKQSEEEPRMEEDEPGKVEVSENLSEHIEEGKEYETVEKIEENAGKTSVEVIVNNESNVVAPGNTLAEEESTESRIPEEKLKMEEPVEEALKVENESPVCGEVDKDIVPEDTPSVVENTENTAPELTEPCKVEKGDAETATEILTPDEPVQDEHTVQKEICPEVKTESDLPEKMDVEETDDMKSEAPDISCQNTTEPVKETGECPPIEVTGKQESTESEETCSNNVPAKVEPKEAEESCKEPSQTPSEESKPEKELCKSDEIKEEPMEETTDKNDDNENEKEEEPGKGRKRRRSRRQSGEVIPARATRSAKKSVDEDVNIFQELPVKETRKRKSQDSDNADVEKVPESGQGEEPSAAEDEEKQAETVEARRDSAANAVSDESSVVVQEQVSEVREKPKKARRKKKGHSRARKRTRKDRRRECKEDENKVAEEGEPTADDEEKEKKAAKSKAKDGTPRPRQLIPERELKLLGISNMEELPTVRQSRRIAQLKMKEEAERKKLEEAAKEEAKNEKKKKKKNKSSKPSAKKRKTAGAGDESYEEEGGGDDDEDADVKQKDKKRKKKKKDKLVFNELNPWISSSGSSSADEDEEDIEDEAHEEEEILFKSDHEFSPESDIEDPDYKPIKRARTAKVDPKDATEADSKYDDTACEKCGEKDHPEWILLCDKCDKGWHASCVRPALMVVPEGDWFCPPCEHTSLILKLRESLVEYDRCQKQRENEELRRKRLAFVGISLDNVLPTKKEKKPKPVMENEGESEETASENGGEDSSSSDSSSSDASSSGDSSEPVYQLRERRSNVTSYRYNEYDELIKSALQEEMEAAKGVGLGKGKDIGNQAEAYEGGAEEAANGGVAEERRDLANVNAETETKAINPQIPKDILEAKPRLKPKKDGDEDYVAESDAEDDEEYNEEENGEAEDEEELGDEVPPVVPRYDKKKKKTRSLNVRGLDFTSDEEEEDNSDSDFKGESTEEESEYSLPSESESSDGIRKKNKNFDGPLRRSTRARTSRYDKEFINDDSEDEAPRKKKSRNIWVESESSDSDRSWGRRKKRNTRGGNRSTMPKKKTKSKAKKKKARRKSGESDYEDEHKSKKSRNRKIKYGGLDDLDEEQVLVRRTRGKKINYQEMNASDSDDEVLKRRPRVIGDSDEEFVAEKEKSGDSDAEDDVGFAKSGANGKAVSKKSILRKIKKKRPKVIPDPDDFSEDDLLEDEELDVFAEELEDLDEEEEGMLVEMLNDGDVPIRELKEALDKLKARRKERTEDAKPYPPIPEHMENPGLTPRFPRIGKMKPAANTPELAAQLALPAESPVPGIRTNPGVLMASLSKDGDQHESVHTEQQGNVMLMNEPKTDSKEGLMGLQPPPYPFPAEGPGLPSLVNAHSFPLNNRPPAPPYNSFQGIIPPHTRLPPEYPHPNIPTTVLGIENDSVQDIRKQGQKPATSNKRKNEDGLSPQADSGEENSGDGRAADNVDSPKRRGRGRGKKQLLAEAQAKQEIAISTVQAPTQFPPRGPGPEGAAVGSVITRMLNTPQGPQPFPPDFARGRSFRPPFANALRPPLNPPSPSPLRTSSTLAGSPSLPLFHVTLPLDIPPSSIGLSQGKPSQLPPGFPARAPVLPRYPSDPSIRPPFPSHTSSPRSEGFPFPNFYPGPFPPPIPNNEESPFQNPNFPGHPFDEHALPGAAGSVKPPYEEEAGGEFGGLASYFASQREDDLDT